jgi:hypothetical protein
VCDVARGWRCCVGDVLGAGRGRGGSNTRARTRVYKSLLVNASTVGRGGARGRGARLPAVCTRGGGRGEGARAAVEGAGVADAGALSTTAAGAVGDGVAEGMTGEEG